MSVMFVLYATKNGLKFWFFHTFIHKELLGASNSTAIHMRVKNPLRIDSDHLITKISHKPKSYHYKNRLGLQKVNAKKM